MRRILSGLILVTAACSRAAVRQDPPVILPPPSTIAEVGRADAGVVTGYVTDEKGRALGDAYVTLLDTKLRAVSDSAGRFRIDSVPPGEHIVRVVHFGFNAARLPFAFAADSGKAFAVRLTVASMQLTEVCLTYLEYSVGVRVKNIRGTTIEIAHGDSVARYALDSLHDAPDKSGMRTVNAFGEEPGRFYVTVAVPGYRDWETNVLVRSVGCHVQRQIVTAALRR